MSSPASLDLDPGKLFGSLPGLDDLRGLAAAVREGGLAAVVLGTERRELMDRVQAFMALLEGYAEHVMDAVGAGVIEDLPRLRARLEQRRADRTGLLRLFERLIGMDMKLRQYEQGKRFCDGVVERGGIAALNRAWEGPALLPRWPSSTIPRVGSRGPLPPRPERPTDGRNGFRPAVGENLRRAPHTMLCAGTERVFHMSQCSAAGSRRVHAECKPACN